MTPIIEHRPINPNHKIKPIYSANPAIKVMWTAPKPKIKTEPRGDEYARSWKYD